MTAVEQAWLDAVADVRGQSRAEIVRQAIRWYCVRETARIERTRHYALIGYLAKQEAWNPVDDHLAAVEEDRQIPEAVQAAFRRVAGERPERALADDYLYVGPERRKSAR
ncbi:MAG TPA: hypothetical protein VKG38_14685 [Solirubrobacteraceae bacterium]|nr:hypothetical protein [Solirubrobacteraceae bacterium]